MVSSSFIKTSVVVLLVGFIFIKYTLQFLPGINLDIYLKYASSSAEAVGFLAASYFYGYLVFQIPAGIIMDKFPLQKVILACLSICLVATMIFGFTDKLFLLLISRFVIGCSVAFSTVAYMKAASLYFSPSQFVRLSGLFGTICMGGSGIIVFVLNSLKKTLPWDEVVTIILIFMIFVISINVVLLVFTAGTIKPQEVLSKQNPWKLSDVRKILSLKANLLLFLYNGLAFTPIVVFGGLWGKKYFLQSFNLREDDLGFLISALFYGFGLGGVVIFRFVKELTSVAKTMIYGIGSSLFLFTILIFIAPYNTSYYVLLTLMTLIGFSASSFLGSYILTNHYNSSLRIGTAVALINMGDPVFAGLAEPLMGKIIDLYNGSYTESMIVIVSYWVVAIFVGVLLYRDIIKEFPKS